METLLQRSLGNSIPLPIAGDREQRDLQQIITGSVQAYSDRLSSDSSHLPTTSQAMLKMDADISILLEAELDDEDVNGSIGEISVNPQAKARHFGDH